MTELDRHSHAHGDAHGEKGDVNFALTFSEKVSEDERVKIAYLVAQLLSERLQTSS